MKEEIDRRRRERHDRLNAFFCTPEDRRGLDKILLRYRARLTAQRIVQQLGFRVLDQQVEEDIVEYIERVEALCQYLRQKRPDEGRVREGLTECSVIAERILRFLCKFYHAIVFCRPGEREGLDPEGRREFSAMQRKLEHEMRGLGLSIKAFRELNRNENIRETLHQLIGRDGVWPDGSHEAPLDALNALNEWRTGRLHYGERVGNALALARGCLEFLEWLLVGDRNSENASRIYPAILTLSVIATNSCGITSVRYVLRQPKSEESSEVTLYTAQPVSVESGCFYGLPHQARTTADLWVDPLLLPVSLFQPTAAT